MMMMMMMMLVAVTWTSSRLGARRSAASRRVNLQPLAREVEW